MFSAAEADAEGQRLSCLRIGPSLLFGRLWEETGIGVVLEELLSERGFEFAVERAVFVAVLHRLFVSGSDRACEKWLADYRIDGVEELQLHHFYRAMARGIWGQYIVFRTRNYILSLDFLVTW